MDIKNKETKKNITSPNRLDAYAADSNDIELDGGIIEGHRNPHAAMPIAGNGGDFTNLN